MFGDPCRGVLRDDANERRPGTALGIETAGAADEIQQHRLPEILRIGGLGPEAAAQ
jgi:hypothetical protein